MSFADVDALRHSFELQVSEATSELERIAFILYLVLINPANKHLKQINASDFIANEEINSVLDKQLQNRSSQSFQLFVIFRSRKLTIQERNLAITEELKNRLHLNVVLQHGVEIVKILGISDELIAALHEILATVIRGCGHWLIAERIRIRERDELVIRSHLKSRLSLVINAHRWFCN